MHLKRIDRLLGNNVETPPDNRQTAFQMLVEKKSDGRGIDPASEPKDGTLASLPWIAASRAAMTLSGGRRLCR